MQFGTIGLLLLGAMALPVSATAQTTPTPPAITRTVVAATKLPTVADVPLYFKAVSVTLQPDEKSGVSAANNPEFGRANCIIRFSAPFTVSVPQRPIPSTANQNCNLQSRHCYLWPLPNHFRAF